MALKHGAGWALGKALGPGAGVPGGEPGAIGPGGGPAGQLGPGGGLAPRGPTGIGPYLGGGLGGSPIPASLIAQGVGTGLSQVLVPSTPTQALPVPRALPSAGGESLAAALLDDRLAAFKQWKQNTGLSGPPSSSQFRRFVGAHRPNSLGETLYFNDNSGFAPWFRGHGNLANSSRPADLYAKYDSSGNFLKWGISQDAATRYSQTDLTDTNGFGEVKVITSGPRSEMLRAEHWLTEHLPGPENLEPWAGRRQPGHPNYIGP